MDRDIGLNGFNIVPGCNNIVHLYRRTVIIICVLLQVYCIVTYFYVNRYQVRNLDSIVDSIDAIGGQNCPTSGQDCPEAGQIRPHNDQSCPPIDRTDLVKVGQNCPRGRTDSSNLLEDNFGNCIGGQNGPPDNIYNIYNRYYIREGVAGAPERSADASLDSASLRKAIYKKEIENLKFLLEILLYG